MGDVPFAQRLKATEGIVSTMMDADPQLSKVGHLLLADAVRYQADTAMELAGR